MLMEEVQFDATLAREILKNSNCKYLRFLLLCKVTEKGDYKSSRFFD